MGVVEIVYLLMLIIILILILFDDSLPVDGAPPAKKRKTDPFADLRDEKVNAVRSSMH